jgi:CBS domain-containing protein
MKIDGMMIEDVVTANGDITIKEAISILHNKHIGSIIITDSNNKCKGIFTERDALRVVATDVSLSTPIREVMTTNPQTVEKGSTFAKAKRIMITHDIRHLPVIDKQGHVVGLLSFRSILDEIHNMRLTES